MARVSFDQVDDYSTGGKWFGIKNDLEVRFVRFLSKDIYDIEGYAVHKIKVDGVDTHVNCLRTPQEPIEACPLCEDGEKLQVKLFLLVYNEDEKQVQVWERGKSYYDKMSSMCSRYSPLVQTIIEIERNGKSGDSNTTYQMYPGKTDETLELKAYKEQLVKEGHTIPAILGDIILDKSKEELKTYVRRGVFTTDTAPKNQRNERNVDVSASKPDGRVRF